MKTTDFARCLGRWLTKALPDEKGLSPKTVKSYKFAFALYLEYMEKICGIDSNRIAMKDLTAESVKGFLDWLEKEKGNSVRTRNLRLAAIRSFVDYVKCNYPELLEESQKILSIASKKAPAKEISYLKKHGVELLASQVNLHAKNGTRDYLMLLLLYSLGLRVSELTGLRVKDINFGEPATLIVYGKGRKSRPVPLLKPVEKYVRKYLEFMGYDVHVDGLAPLFVNHMGEPFTRQGVTYLVKKYANLARKVDPSAIPADLSPHKLRHTCAMEMLASGVDLIYIRDILGHSSVKTTEVYARVDDTIKRKALQKASTAVVEPEEAKWLEDESLKDWLKSF